MEHNHCLLRQFEECRLRFPALLNSRLLHPFNMSGDNDRRDKSARTNIHT